jgi:sulfur-oxidizing protein SoxY
MNKLRREMLTTAGTAGLAASSARLAGLMAASGLLPTVARAQAGGWDKAAFEAKSMAEVARAYGGQAPTANAGVTITGPDIAENGAVVPVSCATTLPGVKRLAILVEKNPNALAAAFNVTDAVEPNFNTRVKMGQSSNVYAVAMMTDGRMLFAQKEIKVTLGGCGG